MAFADSVWFAGQVTVGGVTSVVVTVTQFDAASQPTPLTVEMAMRRK